MKKIVVGGLKDKNEIKDLIVKLSGGQVEVDIKSDLDAAMAIKSGEYDYYVGACDTGSGGALAMAIALLGADKTVTVAMPGNIKDDAFIREQFALGKVAFGFVAQAKEHVLPIIIDEIMK